MRTYVFKQKNGVIQLVRKFNNDKFVKEPRKDSRIMIVTEDEKQDEIKILTPDTKK
jgi:hypothetical protein